MTDEMNEWRDLYRSAVIALRRIEAERDEFEDRATQAESERDAALSRVERLENVLRRVDAINDNPARFSVEINDVVTAALSPPEYPPEQT